MLSSVFILLGSAVAAISLVSGGVSILHCEECSPQSICRALID